jgi:hypothetical protein
MIDFTLNTYEKYLKAIQSKYDNILRFDEYFISDPKPTSFCIIRHDVDRKPVNALRMANLEYNIGIKSTYFFRATSQTFIPNIIQNIASFGHEIGYHYENLAKSKGNIEKAIEDFDYNLSNFRRITPVRTISMHGSPLSSYDNKELWINQVNHDLLMNKYGILGEVTLDIDYTTIAYINDTGRNWSSTKSNIRDKVESLINLEFKDGRNLYSYLLNEPHQKMIFQIHPERWSSNFYQFIIQYCKDKAINTVKFILSGR